jgi:hypothetical protein
MSTSAAPRDTAGSGTAAQNLPRNFDGLQYIASHGDLVQALGADPAAGEQYYLLFGEDEGRPADAFNEEGYPDLRAAFGNNGDAATAHYIRFGLGEGRSYNDPPVAEDDAGEIEEDGNSITVDVLDNG